MRLPRPLAGPPAEEPCLVIDGERLRGVSFAGLRMSALATLGSDFDGCDFRGIRVDAVAFGTEAAPCRYVGCVFDGARLGHVEPGFARFVGCSFRDVRIRNWRPGGVDLIDCVFSGRLDRGEFRVQSTPGGRNVIDGNDFRDLAVRSVAFTGGVDLTRQRLPLSPGGLYLPDLDAALRAAEAELPACPAPLQAGVRRRLARLRRLRDGGQRQAWLPAARSSGAVPAAARWLAAVWRANDLTELDHAPPEPAAAFVTPGAG